MKKKIGNGRGSHSQMLNKTLELLQNIEENLFIHMIQSSLLFEFH